MLEVTENSVLWLGFLFPSFIFGFIITNQRPDLTVLKTPVISELTDNVSWLTHTGIVTLAISVYIRKRDMQTILIF